MDKAAQTMIDNLEKNTGKSLTQWVEIVKKENLAKHSEMIKYLKENHGFTHGFANLVALKARKADADSADNKEDLVEKQYKGKENLREIYDYVLPRILKFGGDIEVAPKNTSVSLRRKKQFALLKPATKTRFEIGFNVKGIENDGVLEYVKSKNSMCSHIIKITSKDGVNDEVLNWINRAYEDAK